MIFQDIVNSISGIVGIFGTLYTLKNIQIASRSKLKTDLEILKHFDKDDPNYIRIKTTIDRTILRIYGYNGNSQRIIHYPGFLIIGLIYSLMFAFVSYNNFYTGDYFLGIVNCLFSIIGLIGGINEGLTTPAQKLEKEKRKYRI